jgi:hypothetical protein
MNLLEALLSLEGAVTARQLQRAHLYSAVTRLTKHLQDVLRCGDTVDFEGRTYELQRAETNTGEKIYLFTVNNGRGPAMLGDRVTNKQRFPFASFDEHLYFATHVSHIVNLFGEVIKLDTGRIGEAEESAITENQFVDRIV